MDYRRLRSALGLELDDDASPPERGTRLPAWMSVELIMTAAATDKLRTWARQTARSEWSEPGDPAALLVELRAYGDPVMLHELARALCRLPRPVADYCLRAVTFVCVGRSFAGWCGSWPENRTPWLIVLSARERLENLIAHEVAHAWLMPEPAGQVFMMPAFVQQTIEATPLVDMPCTAREAVLAARAESARDERQVDRLLQACGIANEF
jgi:hypothetical protein